MLDRKPRLVFFRWTVKDAPQFIRLHLDQHVKCLSERFDVVVVGADCDYRQVCDEHQPDIALFESGVYAGATERRITNVHAYPQIPKIGFCNADAFCFSRSIFFSDMERWGVDTFFGLTLAMAEYTPDIADRLFVWPNGIDPDLYKDYGESKLIPICITGSHAPLYPWRNRVNKALAQRYACLSSPHFGWGDERLTSRMIHGERYARMLNASWMAPTCGTMANELVRKHLEIPGTRTCLITERTPAVEAAGFVDMTNCVFADSSDVVDKVDFLFSDMDRLQQIIDAGYQLVRSRHTMKQRDQVFQWFTLHQQLRPHEMIVQPGPFEPLRVVDRSLGLVNTHVTRNGLDRVLLREGDERFGRGEFNEAGERYRRCLNYYPMSEPKLRLALANLHMGRVEEALRWVVEPLEFTIGRGKALDPDPVEWAYFIIALLCQGSLADASRRASQFPWLRHVELDRARRVVAALSGADAVWETEEDAGGRYSVHRIPERPFSDWVESVRAMLNACHQTGLADRLAQAVSPRRPAEFRSRGGAAAAVTAPEAGGHAERKRALPLRKPSPTVLLLAQVTARVKTSARDLLQRLEALTHPFLPYRVSIMRKDPLCALIERIAGEDVGSRALLIGARAGERVTEALIAGIAENVNRPSLVCIQAEPAGLARLRTRYPGNTFIRFREASVGSSCNDDVEGPFDLVVIDGSELPDGVECREMQGAGVVVLDDINGRANQEQYSRLMTDGGYVLVTHDLEHRRGYAIFRRLLAGGEGRLTAAEPDLVGVAAHR